MVLWTNKSANELLADESIICARLPPMNSPLHKLVAKHQIHRCDINSCQKGEPGRNCRFGFPKLPSPNAYFDENDRAIYKRSVIDTNINPYNPFLLAMFETNIEAKHENFRQLVNLDGEMHRLVAIDYPAQNQAAKTALNFDTNLPEMLYIKNNAMVMLVKNLDVAKGWNNGTLCIIKAIYMDAIHVERLQTGASKLIHRVQDYVPNTIYTRRQFPIRPAYASTIHKVQSLTLPRVAINFGNFPYHGQLYVAMSRVRSADDIFFTAIERGNVERLFQLYANCDAIQIINEFTPNE